MKISLIYFLGTYVKCFLKVTNKINVKTTQNPWAIKDVTKSSKKKQNRQVSEG